MGGHLTTNYGLVHHPNLPTEEVFTVPDPERVQGTVRSSKPLQLDGSVVRDFTVEFDGGRVKRIEAAANGEALATYASTRRGRAPPGRDHARRRSGRVGPLGTVFYDTLIDENAPSHIALGAGFDCAVGDDEIPRANRSEIHVDFMFGRSDEVEVDGVTDGGEQIRCLRGGAWRVRRRLQAGRDRDPRGADPRPSLFRMRAWRIGSVGGLAWPGASPLQAALIGASNFFELAVAAAISLFGLDAGAALATVVSIVEVPVMLSVVRIVKATRGWYEAGAGEAATAVEARS